MKRVTLSFCMFAALASLAMAIEGVSPEKGKALFTNKQLGTSGKSCDSCHPDGKGLKHAAAYYEGRLGMIINQCIKNPLKGKELDPSSAEMISLIMYIKTLAPSTRF